jgi:hypothetical protein
LLLLKPFAADCSRIIFYDLIVSAFDFVRSLPGDFNKDLFGEASVIPTLLGVENLNLDKDLTDFIPKSFINSASI